MKREFETLEQRMIHTYIDTFPSFVPSEDGPGIAAQNQFYQFMSGLYRRLSDAPGMLFRDLHADDAYTHRFNKGADQKPKLRDQMRKVVKEVDSLLGAMFLIGQSGRVDADTCVVDASVKLSKKHLLLLGQLGLHPSATPDCVVFSHSEYPELFHAWTWMATRAGASLLDFSRCLFREGYPYASEIYTRLSGNEDAFRRLEGYLIDNGYTRMDNWDGTVAVDYYKTHGDSAPTKGGFQYGIHHTGISASYDLLMDEPPVFGLCIPRMKEILTAFDSIEPGIQDFVVARTKKCDGCRYCVQTDKTGMRPLANIPVNHKGQQRRLCPYYPGYYYCWTTLSDELVNDLIAMLSTMDRLFDGV